MAEQASEPPFRLAWKMTNDINLLAGHCEPLHDSQAAAP